MRDRSQKLLKDDMKGITPQADGLRRKEERKMWLISNIINLRIPGA